LGLLRGICTELPTKGPVRALGGNPAADSVSGLLKAGRLRMLISMPDTSTPMPASVGRPALRAFEAAGYRTLADLDGTSELALLALHGVGPRAIRILREHGVALRP
jgi:hypothetical protein